VGLETGQLSLPLVVTDEGKFTIVKPAGKFSLTPPIEFVPEVIVNVMVWELPAQTGVELMLICAKTTFPTSEKAKINKATTSFDFGKNVLMQYV
jgi:hypothetical protein